MKIVLISMVRNEADVIELFARYHAEFVDELLIADHHSLDDTREILSELAVEGLPIRVCQNEGAAFDQSRQLTELMKRASAECGADWVLPLDADEFLICASGRSLRAAVEGLSSVAPARLSWRNYVPTDDDPTDEPHLLRRMTYRREVDAEDHKKVLIPGPLACDPKTSLTHGNHRLVKRGWRRAKTVEPIEAQDLAIAHFPLRTLEQAIVKGLVGWPGCLANEKYRPSKFWNQQRKFDEILRGNASSPAWFIRFASTYAQSVYKENDAAVPVKLVHDPVREPRPIELRWPNPRAVPPLAVVSEMAEQLARQLGELRRNETE